MQRNSFLVIVSGLLLAGGLGVGGYFLTKSLWPATSNVAPPTLHPPGVRPKGTVPSVPFTDINAAAGLHFKHTNGATPKKLLPETMSGGVAFLDIDNDDK